MKELILSADIANITAVNEFIDAQLTGMNCPEKALRQIHIAIDELFGNIARYAYYPGTGPVRVRVELSERPRAVEITLTDRGVRYDPLAREDPDTGLPIEERDIGGLGIFIVKKSMDEVCYAYQEGQNILKIRKLL